MEPKTYTVAGIDGEYATLREEDGSGEIFIALALLPQGTDVGTRLRYELMEYTILS